MLEAATTDHRHVNNDEVTFVVESYQKLSEHLRLLASLESGNLCDVDAGVTGERPPVAS